MPEATSRICLSLPISPGIYAGVVLSVSARLFRADSNLGASLLDCFQPADRPRGRVSNQIAGVICSGSQNGQITAIF